MGTRIKRSRRRLYPEEELAIERMIFEGADDSEIANTLGISQSMVITQRKSAEHFRAMVEKYKKLQNAKKEENNKAELRLLNTFKEGEVYVFDNGYKNSNWVASKYTYESPMVYKGSCRNVLGKLLFMFANLKGGWVETFTAQQLKDVVIKRVD